MHVLFAFDWAGIFVPSVPAGEIILRGSLVYLALFAILRLVPRREAGTVGLADLLLVVLIADAAQNAMSAEYHSVTDGVLLVATLVFWNYALDWLGYRFPFVGRLLHPPALLLIKDGRLLRRNMRQELVGEEELMSELRKQGLKEVSEVREARLEGDGHISIVPSDSEKRAGDKGNETKHRVV
jgi:uncharacterized membrane protein YcaP (DUF421 family)